jgi:hypothetical protein
VNDLQLVLKEWLMFIVDNSKEGYVATKREIRVNELKK